MSRKKIVEFPKITQKREIYGVGPCAALDIRGQENFARHAIVHLYLKCRCGPLPPLPKKFFCSESPETNFGIKIFALRVYFFYG